MAGIAGLAGPQSDQEVTAQAAVTGNFHMSANRVNEMLQFMAGKSPSDFIGGQMNAAGLNVDRQDLVFVVKQHIEKRGLMGMKVVGNPPAFSTFNGQYKKDCLTQEDFERQFSFVGVATSGVELTEGTGSNRSGFAVQMSGSVTIHNASNTVFGPGDIVRWRAPSIKGGAALAEQYKSVATRRRGNFSTAGRYTATLDRVTYQDIKESFQKTALFVLDNNKSLSITRFRDYVLRAGALKNLPEFHNAIVLKQFINFCAYQGVILAFQRGLVVPAWDYLNSQWSTFATDSFKVQNWNLNRAKITQKDGWKNMRLNSITKEFEPVPRDESVAYNDSMQTFAEVMALTFGLAKDSTKQLISEDTGLSTMLAGRTLLSSLVGLENPKDLIDVATNEFVVNPPSNRLNLFGMPNAYTPNIGQQIKNIQGDASDSLAKLLGLCYNDIFSCTIGTCSNVSMVNGPLHLVMH